MLPHIDTRVPSEVEEHVQAIYLRLFPEGDRGFIPRSFGWAEECFTGRHPGYQAIDAAYHDLEHTLQGTICLARIWQGRAAAGVAPVVPRRLIELSLLAILFHDTGYLKKVGDREGTGAKYTLTHVTRSADFAAEFLAPRGVSEVEIRSIRNMILCTGVSVVLAKIPFQSAEERIGGCVLATADLLGQMAADDYVIKLPELYDEFAEAVRFAGADSAGMLAHYRNADDLLRETPKFWQDFVLPRIEGEFGGQHRFLNQPWPDGPNKYLEQIERNLKAIGTATDAK
jgi:hypothetical protein